MINDHGNNISSDYFAKRYKEIIDFINTGEYDLKNKDFAPLHARTVPIKNFHYWNELEKHAELWLKSIKRSGFVFYKH